MTVDPTHIDDSVPTEDEVEAAVKKFWRNISGGPSRIRAEHVKGWLAAARRGGMAEEKGKAKTATEEEVGSLHPPPRSPSVRRILL